MNRIANCFIYLSTLTLFCCNEKVTLDKDYCDIIDPEIRKEIKDYYNRNKSQLNEEFVIQLFTYHNSDTSIVDISYESNMFSPYYNNPQFYGFVDDIPYVLFTGMEEIVKIHNDSILRVFFFRKVFKQQYLKYINQKKPFPPPVTGSCEVVKLYIIDDKVMRKEYTNNLIKGSIEIVNTIKTVNDSVIDSIFDVHFKQ